MTDGLKKHHLRRAFLSAALYIASTTGIGMKLKPAKASSAPPAPDPIIKDITNPEVLIVSAATVEEALEKGLKPEYKDYFDAAKTAMGIKACMPVSDQLARNTLQRMDDMKTGAPALGTAAAAVTMEGMGTVGSIKASIKKSLTPA
jgi:hypothetical protein